MDKADKEWIVAELRARDRALQSLKDTGENAIAHLDRLRDETLDKDFYYREHEALVQRVGEISDRTIARIAEDVATLRKYHDDDIDRLETRVTTDVARIEARMNGIEGHLQRITGTYVGYAVVAAIFISIAAGFLGHLFG